MTVSKKLITGECLGVKFVVDEHWQFCAASLDIREPSFGQMKDKIEKAQKNKAATERAKLFIPAMWCNGGAVVEGVLTGLHAGHGKLLADPALGVYSNFVYPRIAWLKLALAEELILRARASHIGRIAKQFSVSGRDGFAFDPKTHADNVKRIEREMAEKLKAGSKTDLETELKKTPKPKEIEL